RLPRTAANHLERLEMTLLSHLRIRHRGSALLCGAGNPAGASVDSGEAPLDPAGASVDSGETTLDSAGATVDSGEATLDSALRGRKPGGACVEAAAAIEENGWRSVPDAER